jgi:hypothetical protein
MEREFRGMVRQLLILAAVTPLLALAHAGQQVTTSLTVPAANSGSSIVQPASGVPGYRLATEYVFGAGGNVKTLADLSALFAHDAPWGRINGELQRFKPFNPENHVFGADNLALTGMDDGSGNFTEFGHITSGALVSRLTVSAPCIVEIVAMLPSGRGVWPSLWLYDTHSGKPDSSEIDIMESQFNAPIGHRDDRSLVYQNVHGPGVGPTLSNPGGLDRWGRWAPYGRGSGFLDQRYAAYSVLWETDKVTEYIDNKAGVTRAFRWTGPSDANILVYNSIGSDVSDWPGPVSASTFSGDNARFRIKSIRIFKPAI